LRKRSEAGVDAVGRLIAARAADDHLTRDADAGARAAVERDGFTAVRNREELFDGQRRAVELNHGSRQSQVGSRQSVGKSQVVSHEVTSRQSAARGRQSVSTQVES